MELDVKLHHIGCAVEDIEVAKQYYMEVFGYSYLYEIADEEINMKSVFIEKDGHCLELLQAIDSTKESKISKILEIQGGGAYHHCYEVEDLESSVKKLRNFGFVKYQRKIKQTDYFKYIYVITPDNYLIELLEVVKE